VKQSRPAASSGHPAVDRTTCEDTSPTRCRQKSGLCGRRRPCNRHDPFSPTSGRAGPTAG